MQTLSISLAIALLLTTACGGGAEETAPQPADPPVASTGDEVTVAAPQLLECALEGVGPVGVAAPADAELRPNQTGCVVFVGEGANPADDAFVAQWGAVPSEAESAESFVRSRGMLGEFEVIDQNEASFLGAPAQVSHVSIASPPGIGEPREGWLVWASRGDANVLLLALCRPDDASCAAIAQAMIAGSQ